MFSIGVPVRNSARLLRPAHSLTAWVRNAFGFFA